MLPQVGQGALAVECRADDPAALALLAAIEHEPSRRRVDAERAFLAELGGDCDLPAGAHAVVRPRRVRWRRRRRSAVLAATDRRSAAPTCARGDPADGGPPARRGARPTATARGGIPAAGRPAS